jgi:hypothetical protein
MIRNRAKDTVLTSWNVLLDRRLFRIIESDEPEEVCRRNIIEQEKDHVSVANPCR